MASRERSLLTTGWYPLLFVYYYDMTTSIDFEGWSVRSTRGNTAQLIALVEIRLRARKVLPQNTDKEYHNRKGPVWHKVTVQELLCRLQNAVVKT